MKIDQLKIDGFGVWSGLELDGLSDRANVIFGPNESGKTTLLQFVRCMLYGFSPARRQRYLPPVAGGDAGGILLTSDEQGSLEIGRHDTPGADATVGTLRVVAPDGTLGDERRLAAMLGGVDEATFNNVFAVGLREVQELATLNDSDAAAQLYHLTTGLDRISLADVLRDLRASRDRLLATDGQTGQIPRLLAQRKSLQTQIDELSQLTETYSQVALRRQRLNQDIHDAEQRAAAAEQQTRAIEIAATLRETWLRRSELEQRLAALGDLVEVPADELTRLNELGKQIEHDTARLRGIKARRADIKRQATAFQVNQAIWRQAPRIGALCQQQEWAALLEEEIAQSGQEVAALENELAAHHRRLGWDTGDEPVAALELSGRAMRSLKAPARRMQETQHRYVEARGKREEARRNASQRSAEISSALADRAQSDLTTALEAAGNTVSQLRRVMQLDERIDNLNGQRKELQEQAGRMLGGQMLPGWVLAALGAAFVGGVVLLLSGLLLPTSIIGSVGWGLAVLGLGGTVGAMAVKYSLERTAAGRADATAKRLELIETQLSQANQERDALSARIPRGGGPLSVRLQTAETDLAGLEELLSLEGRRQVAEQEAVAADTQLRAAEDERRAARKEWRRALGRLGIPKQLSPRQVRRLHRERAELEDLNRRLCARREQQTARRRQLDALTKSIDELAAEAQLALDGTTISTRLEALRRALDEQQSISAEREKLRQRWRGGRRREVAVGRRLARAQDRRRRIFALYGVVGQQEFDRLAEMCRRRADLRGELAEIDRQIQTAAAGKCETQDLMELLSADATPDFDARRADLLSAAADAREELKRLCQRHGECHQQLATLAADRRLPEKQWELCTIEQQLRDAARQWLVLATAATVLDEVRARYERERQPETLRQASQYLRAMTAEHYVRVWTPLDEDVLYVDDAAGRRLPVELLSRGTREQVFLCLRLALAAGYARRGARLPLVLDDVLVNFDAGRARAAARVLRDFAAAGHQVLLFTCHEHMLKLFKSLRVPVVRLPAHAASTANDEREIEVADRPAAATKRPRQPVSEPAAALDEEQEIEDLDADQEYEEDEVETEAYDDDDYEEEYEEGEYEEVEDEAEEDVDDEDDDQIWDEESEVGEEAAEDDDDEIEDDEDDYEEAA